MNSKKKTISAVVQDKGVISAKNAESTPKIGIVIPIYNVAKYLRECLDSVVNQTYGNFCAVLVNDGSSDDSKEIALGYVVKDSRFVIIDKENGGLSSARNAGIDYFNGEMDSSLQNSMNRTILASLRGSEADEAIQINKTIDCHESADADSRNDGISMDCFGDELPCNDESFLDCHDSALLNLAMTGNKSSLRGVANAEAIQTARHTERSEVSKSREFQTNNELMTKGRINKSRRFTQNQRITNDSQIAKVDSSLTAFAQNDESSHLTLYTNKNATNSNPPKIDYIIFLDSDDFWELDLLEKCIDSARIAHESNANPDIIWFDWNEIYEVSGKIQGRTTLELFGFATQTQITARQWLQRAKEREILQFWWAWKGLIRFDYLMRVNLRFLEGVIFEDNLFGVLLFSQCESIAIVPRKLYNYRIRGGSTTNSAKSLPPFVAPLKAHFSTDSEAWAYFCAYSLCEMSLEFANFCANRSEKNRAKSCECGESKLCESIFLPNFLAESCDILAFSSDPLNAKSRFIALLKKRRKYSPYLKIIAHIVPRRFKRLRFALFLFYFAPKVAFFRTIRKILKTLRICRG